MLSADLTVGLGELVARTYLGPSSQGGGNSEDQELIVACNAQAWWHLGSGVEALT